MPPKPTTEPGKSAILVVDVINDFVYSGGVIADAGGPDYQARVQAMLPTLQRLLDAARKTGVTVIHAPDAHVPEDAEVRVRDPQHLFQGRPPGREHGDPAHGSRGHAQEGRFAAPPCGVEEKNAVRQIVHGGKDEVRR